MLLFFCAEVSVAYKNGAVTLSGLISFCVANVRPSKRFELAGKEIYKKYFFRKDVEQTFFYYLKSVEMMVNVFNIILAITKTSPNQTNVTFHVNRMSDVNRIKSLCRLLFLVVTM